ncbi:MAG: NAD(P)-dependent oxidoreductase [Salinivirgaceae bacterium]
METKILVTQYIPKEGLSELFEKYYVIMPGKSGFTREEQLELIKDADVLLSLFNAPVDKELIAAGKKLRMIANFGVGYNNIDLEYARQRNLVVSNTPDPVTIPTAEHTMGLILAVMRRISEMDRKIRQNQVADWKVMSNLGFSLQNKTLGIIGMGKIGQATTRMAQAFGMKVVYHSRNKIDKSLEASLNTTWLELNDLLHQSDVVSLHVPLTGETTHLIGKCELIKMKDTAFIINTARGPIINEAELVEALQEKEIAGAALDVFEAEPAIHQALLSMNNVVLTPHIGTGTIETRIATAQCAADNIVAFLERKQVPNRVI